MEGAGGSSQRRRGGDWVVYGGEAKEGERGVHRMEAILLGQRS